VNQRRVRDESQLDDMRAAIRGDFERLAERRGGQDLMHVREREPEPEPESAVRPELEQEADLVPELEQPDDEVSDAPDEEPKRGLWARLLGL
jgi:hypothetical protein